jgi:transposase
MGAFDFVQGSLYHEQVSGSVTRKTFVAFMERLIAKVARPDVPTFIVLDHARIHHGLDETITRQWMEKFHTSLYFLPPYSPELNMIEILWKQAKYLCHMAQGTPSQQNLRTPSCGWK